MRRLLCRIGLHFGPATGRRGVNVYGILLFEYRCRHCKALHYRPVFPS